MSSPDAPTDPPELDDPPGRLDNWLVYAIAVSPVVVILTGLVTTVGIVATGALDLSVTITGSLPVSVVWRTVAAPFLLFLLAAFVFLWILAVMAWFGAAPVIRIARFLEGLVRDYEGRS